VQPLIADAIGKYSKNIVQYEFKIEGDKKQEVEQENGQIQEENKHTVNVQIPSLKLRNMKPRRSVVAAMLPSLSLVSSKTSQINSKVSKIIEDQKQQQSKI
jgi:hypothetical protein